MHVRIVESWSAKAGIVDDQIRVALKGGNRFSFFE
jgi:hypothetical protein